jgi:hypothetical protein
MNHIQRTIGRRDYRRVYGLYLEWGSDHGNGVQDWARQKRNWATNPSRGKQQRQPRKQLATRQTKSSFVKINPAAGTVATETAPAAWVASK